MVRHANALFDLFRFISRLFVVGDVCCLCFLQTAFNTASSASQPTTTMDHHYRVVRLGCAGGLRGCAGFT